MTAEHVLRAAIIKQTEGFSYEELAFHLIDSYISPDRAKIALAMASSRNLKELMERDLSGHDFAVLFIDGKSFADDEMIIALGGHRMLFMGYARAILQ